MEFYARTADQYDSWHVDAHDEHFAALGTCVKFVQDSQSMTLLDVGCGTGRALTYFASIFPQLTIRGIDPSEELLQIAVSRNRVPKDWLTKGDGYKLPFEGDSFDAVIATGVLHHVEHPERIVAEMMRVARKLLFISDTNTYGQGRFAYRIVKVLARGLKLSEKLNRLRYRGQNWFESPDDGIAFPYSVFDSVNQVRGKFGHVRLVPTAGSGQMHRFPLLFATHVLLVGSNPLRDGTFEREEAPAAN